MNPCGTSKWFTLWLQQPALLVLVRGQIFLPPRGLCFLYRPFHSAPQVVFLSDVFQRRLKTMYVRALRSRCCGSDPELTAYIRSHWCENLRTYVAKFSIFCLSKIRTVQGFVLKTAGSVGSWCFTDSPFFKIFLSALLLFACITSQVVELFVKSFQRFSEQKPVRNAPSPRFTLP